MASLEEIRQTRLKKLEILKKHGINPYPSKVPYDFFISELKNNFDERITQGNPVSVVGRVMALRGQGAILFAVLFDGTDRIQAIIKKDVLKSEDFSLFVDTVDVGDFISVTGKPILSERGEQSVLAESWSMAAKSLLSLPEKWHGLQDIEERYRRRYLDLIMNSKVKDVFVIRSKIIESIREFLLEREYFEVQTPILQPIYGGGSARPFVSNLNALDMQVYMRISNELYLKRLVVGGFPKIFEFSVDFRNEGIDRSHNPEFTLFEAMTAYTDYNFGMCIIEDITAYVVKEITGGTKVTYQGTELDFKKSWRRISMRDAIAEYASIDIEQVNDNELEKFLDRHNIKLNGQYNRGNAIMAISEEFCEKNFIQPTILYDYPVETSPLAKPKASNPKYVERFEQYIFGMEVGNNYSELNDPNILEENWKKQEDALKMGDLEAQRMDGDFLSALEVGMPPTCGIAISIDRLTMLLTDQHSIRDVILFPFMRPTEEKKNKDKETYVVTAIVNSGAGLERWQVMNTVAHLSAAFGARSKKNLFKFDSIKTADDKNIKLNIQHAIIIKEASSSDEVWKLSDIAQERGLEVAHFTREMIETTNDNMVAEQTKSKNHADIDFLGLLIFGPKSEVEELTKNLKLFS